MSTKLLIFILLIAVVPALADDHGCGPNEHWDNDMQMCHPNQTIPQEKSNQAMFHINQFLVRGAGSGPRGRNALSGQNMWMLELTHKTSDRNSLAVEWMGTTDLWTVPKKGYPLLLQTGESDVEGNPYIDAQHPHSSPIMGLTFMDILSLGNNKQHKLTFFFAPRGEATAGPQAFMHRSSALGNPNAPLSHHLEDVFHISSTVAGLKLENDKGTTVEVSGFSGVEPSPGKVDLDVHAIDSYALRLNQALDPRFKIGGSFARTKAQHQEFGETGHVEMENAYSAWVQTRHSLGEGQLDTSSVWGQVDNTTEDIRLNSFLEEFVYQLGSNHFFGRVEVLQRTPSQLQIEVSDSQTGAQWVKVLTLGYERKVFTHENLNIFAGGDASKYLLPAIFKDSYGGDPVQGQVFLRMTWNGQKQF